MLKKGLAVFVLAFVAASVAWLVDFDATELGSRALREASASTGIELDASRYRLNVLRGLELKNVEASARFPGGRYTIAMPAMRFDHRVLSLLSGQLEIERVLLTEPRVAIVIGLEPELTSKTSPPSTRARRPRERSEKPSTERAAPPVELRIREVELAQAAFAFNDELSLDGVDLSLQSPALASGALTILHAITATGQISIEELRFRTMKLQNIAATLALSGGRLELADAAFETEQGSFQANLHVNFNTLPARHRLSLTGQLREVPGEVSFEGEGFGLDAANLKGDGRWTVPAGRFDASPLWQILELTDTAYEATEIPFQIADGRLMLDGLWLRGSVGLDGTLDLVVSGTKVTGTWDSPILR